MIPRIIHTIKVYNLFIYYKSLCDIIKQATNRHPCHPRFRLIFQFKGIALSTDLRLIWHSWQKQIQIFFDLLNSTSQVLWSCPISIVCSLKFPYLVWQLFWDEFYSLPDLPCILGPDTATLPGPLMGPFLPKTCLSVSLYSDAEGSFELWLLV